jgi:hypothetical protein
VDVARVSGIARTQDQIASRSAVFSGTGSLRFPNRPTCIVTLLQLALPSICGSEPINPLALLDQTSCARAATFDLAAEAFHAQKLAERLSKSDRDGYEIAQ